MFKKTEISLCISKLKEPDRKINSKERSLTYNFFIITLIFSLLIMINLFNKSLVANAAFPSAYIGDYYNTYYVSDPNEINRLYERLGGESSFLGSPIREIRPVGDNRGYYRQYAYGNIYWTPETGAREVHSWIYRKYYDIDFMRSPLGYPTSNVYIENDPPLEFSEFENGIIYWTPENGALTVEGKIDEKWSRFGWDTGFLGKPLTDTKVLSDGGKFNVFQDGSIFLRPDGDEAFEIHGLIRQKWKSFGWDRTYAYTPRASDLIGFLGYPTTDELTTSDRNGRYNRFQGGSIYWKTGTTEAFEVHGPIQDKWALLNWESGVLGYPVTDQRITPDGVGKYNHFRKGSIEGSIYLAPGSDEAFEVHGPIRTKWSMIGLGWERSFLGYPITDELTMLDGIGKYNDFQNGSIYWTRTTGANYLSTDLRERWLSLGGPAVLGYPTHDEGRFEDAYYADFENRWAIVKSSAGIYEVDGPIYDKWAIIGGIVGRTGYPITDKITESDGSQHNDFQNGSIYYTQRTEAHYLDVAIKAYWLQPEQQWLGYPVSDQIDRPDIYYNQFEYGYIYVSKIDGSIRPAAILPPIPQPVISELSPNRGSVGASINIVGSNFFNERNIVKFNGINATIDSWSNTLISVRVPTGATSGPVTITTAGGTSTGINFTVESSTAETRPPSEETMTIYLPLEVIWYRLSTGAIFASNYSNDRLDGPQSGILTKVINPNVYPIYLWKSDLSLLQSALNQSNNEAELLENFGLGNIVSIPAFGTYENNLSTIFGENSPSLPVLIIATANIDISSQWALLITLRYIPNRNISGRAVLPPLPDGQRGWYKQIPSVTFDESETGNTWYRWDNESSYTQYSSPFTVPEGNHTLYYYSVDSSGIEETATKSFKVDTGLPRDPQVSSSSHTLNRQSSDNTIDLALRSVEDSVSGVAGYSVEWNNEADTLPDSVMDVSADQSSVTSEPLDDGTWYFHLRTVDNAGNWTSTVHQGPFIIDTSIPSTTLLKQLPSADSTGGWYKTSPIITLSSSKISNIYYSWNSSIGPWSTYTGTFSAPQGQNRLYYFSVDESSKTETTTNQLFKVDSNNPEVPELSGTVSDIRPVSLSWTPSSDSTSWVTSYNIYNDNDNLMATTKETSITFANVDLGKTYSYYVRAKDAAGNLSSKSNVVTLTTRNNFNESVTSGEKKVVNLGSGVFLYFDEITQNGNISAINKLPDKEAPDNYKFINGSYFDLTTTADYSGYIYVTLPYKESDIKGIENKIKLFHWENGNWRDVTFYVDTQNNEITGRVTSLSPFGVGEPDGGGSVVGYSDSWLIVTIISLMATGGYLLIRRKETLAM